MTARRPVLTAAAAGSVLLALWFVPSANATVEEEGSAAPQTRAAQAARAAKAAENAAPGERPADLSLADTGAVDTTPYVMGGAAFLALGAGLVSYSVRRTRGTTS